jgi:uncharacterized lipoprotein YajG
MKTPTLLFLATCALLQVGCAFGDRKVSLRYQPVVGASGGGGRSIAVAKFTDQRAKPEVGVVRNGFGIPTAKAVAQGQDVGAWVASALATELEAAGFKVERLAGGNGGQSIVVSGTVTEAFTDIYMVLNSDIAVNVNVRRAGATKLSKTYRGHETDTAWTASSKEYEEVLTKALQKLMQELVPDVIRSL